MGLTFLTSTMLTGNTGDNTSLRAYGTAISNALASSGWVQANDAGQIDWTTVVANGSTSAYHGCEIWRMNDALANTVPCYMRIDYSTASGGPNRPRLDITLGHSTNGALGLTGALSANLTFNTTYSTGTPYASYFHGSTGSFGMTLWEPWSQATLFGIERSKDANGNDTSEGFNVIYGLSSIAQFFWSPWTGQAQAAENPGVFTGGTPANRSGIGSAFNWYPIYVSNGRFMPPLLNWVISVPYQAQTNGVMTLTHYGEEHKYRGVTGITATVRSGSISAILLMRWE